MVLIVLVFILPESPKWLYNKKKYAQFEKVMNQMAKFNGKTINPEKFH